MPIFSSRDKSGNISVNFMFVDGIPGFHKGEAVNVTLDQQAAALVFVKRLNKRERAELALSKVTSVQAITDEQIIEKDKSVVGRAAVGAMVLGPLGALVGGMSGIGSKKGKAVTKAVVVTYQSGSQEKAVALEVVGASIGWEKLVRAFGQEQPSGTRIL